MNSSLNWRCRYVVAIEPSKKDLDANHPLFVVSSTRNVFQRLWREREKKDGGGKRPAKRARTVNNENTSSKAGNSTPLFSVFGANPMPKLACWVEVLCRCPGAIRDCQKGKSTHSKPKMHWLHVDLRHGLVNQPEIVEAVLYAERKGIAFKEARKKVPIPYALAVEHISVAGTLKTRLTDVTPRYASSWIESLKARGVLRGKQTKVKDSDRVDKWWTQTLKSVNSGGRRELLKAKGNNVNDAILLDGESTDEDKMAANSHFEEVDEHEKEELKASAKDEPMPTSKTAFTKSPIYVIPSILNSNEVLLPDAKNRVCGVFKGELVFRRSDVECALAAKRWLYKGRKVKESELTKPIKRIKARKKSSKNFKSLKTYGIGEGNDGSQEAREKQLEAASKPLDDGKENLYASWQTDLWSPAPVRPNDPIPVNEHNNIELELLNPGLVHIDEQGIAKAAKQLGV